jgi:hypothetical protein
MKPNGFGQRQLSEDSGNNRKKQLARSDATCIEEPPRPATAGRPASVFSPSEAPCLFISLFLFDDVVFFCFHF